MAYWMFVTVTALLTMSVIYLGKQIDSLRAVLRDQDATLDRIHTEMEFVSGALSHISDNTFQVTPEGRRRADEAARPPSMQGRQST